MTKILSGKVSSDKIKEELKSKLMSVTGSYSEVPKLVIIQVGENKASNIYIRNKINFCREVGIKALLMKYSDNVSENEICDIIRYYNSDILTHGIIVQTPLPDQISYDSIIKVIDPDKDVDGFHSDNMGRTCLGLPGIKPATALGVVRLLETHDIDYKGKDIVVIGRGQHVGLPISIMLGNNDMGTVTSCHINTKDLKDKCLKADIIVSAVGKPKFITEDMVKQGCVIVDVGINRDENGKLCGDVDFDNVEGKCSAISPVPGGVGPMTVSSLAINLVYTWEKLRNNL